MVRSLQTGIEVSFVKRSEIAMEFGGFADFTVSVSIYFYMSIQILFDRRNGFSVAPLYIYMLCLK